MNNYKSSHLSSFFAAIFTALVKKKKQFILISSQVKLFSDGLILKQHQMSFAVSGDVRTVFEAFMYSLSILISIL